MRHRLGTLVFALGVVAGGLPRAGLAQASRQEFTTQGLLIGNFESKPENLGRKVSDRVRDRVDDAFRNTELKLVGRRAIETELLSAGFALQMALARTQTTQLARRLRADEYVTGTVARVGGKYRVEGYLVLTRDDRLRQQLPPAEDADLERAADRVAAALVAARAQLAPQRRCENLQREGKYAEAMAAALPALVAYPRSTIARACYLVALAHAGASADSMLAVANQILAVDPASAIALQNAGIAHDAKRDRPRAGDAWTRLLATDTASTSLTAFVVNKLARGGNSAAALPIAERAAERWPHDAEIARLHFLVLLALEQWKPAIAAGERLAAIDSTATVDPQYFERLASAYRADSQPARALVVAARGVATHANDADLYALYAQLVRAEAEAVLPRGVERFAGSAKLQALHAQALRAAGTPGALRQSLEATRRALALDPTLPRGFLQLAQLHMDLGAPDSALAALATALDHGEDTARVAQYALARGNALYKAAAAAEAKQIPEFQRAAGFLALAARLAPTREGRFLLGATAFSVGQLAIAEAARTRDCATARLAASSFAEVETGLPSAGAVSPDAARQMLEYVAAARPALGQQLATFCAAP